MILLFLYKIDKHYIYLEICDLNSKPAPTTMDPLPLLYSARLKLKIF